MKALILSTITFLTFGMAQAQEAGDQIEFAGYVTAWRCSSEGMAIPCMNREKLEPQNFTMTLKKGPNNDTYAKHTVQYQKEGYSFVATYYLYRWDVKPDFSMTISMEVTNPEGQKSQYNIGAIRLNDLKTIAPVRMFGREITTANTAKGERLNPYVYFGLADETFKDLSPYTQY